MKKKIHIFCMKPQICSLIKKRFMGSNYVITCSNVDDFRENLLESLQKNIDCIIIEKDIKFIVKDKIKQYFKNKPIICLPSLESDSQFESDPPDGESGVKIISEPLRLSELAETLDDIFALQ